MGTENETKQIRVDVDRRAWLRVVIAVHDAVEAQCGADSRLLAAWYLLVDAAVDRFAGDRERLLQHLVAAAERIGFDIYFAPEASPSEIFFK